MSHDPLSSRPTYRSQPAVWKSGPLMQTADDLDLSKTLTIHLGVGAREKTNENSTTPRTLISFY